LTDQRLLDSPGRLTFGAWKIAVVSDCSVSRLERGAADPQLRLIEQ